jgi:16S rRNA (cytosine967-C5)-methyltransferase
MPRITAWTALRSGSPTPLREIDRLADEAELNPPDRGLARALVGMEIRRRGTLRALAQHFLHGKAKPEIMAHLHLGLVQLFFMDRIPDHAAVSESARAARATLGPHAVRVVNGVLRNAARARNPGRCGDPRRDIPLRDEHLEEPFLPDPAIHPLLWAEAAYSMPAPMLKRWQRFFGEERTEALALAEPPLSVRVVRGERQALLEELTGAELEGDALHPIPGLHPDVFLVPASETDVALRRPAFAEGRITVQGATALAAAEAVQAQAGERILDLCAAPGGKTAVLAAAGAEVTAADVSEGRLERLHETLARLGLAERVRTVVSDGTRDLATDETFDAVLVDAPCSNTGVLAQRPEARWRFGPALRAELETLQRRLLDESAPLVRPGGRLVWSTCSLEPEENERLVRAWLEEHLEFTLEAEATALPDPIHGGDSTESTPGAGPVDGGYWARLRRAN